MCVCVCEREREREREREVNTLLIAWLKHSPACLVGLSGSNMDIILDVSGLGLLCSA